MTDLAITKYSLHGASQEQGFSLIEVLVALFVLSVAILGIAGLQVTSKQTNFESVQRTTATFLAQELLERIRTNETQLTVYTAAGLGRTIELQTSDNIAVTNCNTATCDPATLAMYDLYEFSQAIRGVAEMSGINATGGLVEPTVCITGPDTTPGFVSVAIAWRGNVRLSDPTANNCGSTSGRYDDAGDANVLRRLLVVDAFVE